MRTSTCRVLHKSSQVTKLHLSFKIATIQIQFKKHWKLSNGYNVLNILILFVIHFKELQHNQTAGCLWNSNLGDSSCFFLMASFLHKDMNSTDCIRQRQDMGTNCIREPSSQLPPKDSSMERSFSISLKFFPCAFSFSPTSAGYDVNETTTIRSAVTQWA